MSTPHTANRPGEVADKARDLAHDVTDKAKNLAEKVTDTAKAAAGAVVDKAKDVANATGRMADNATAAVGSGVESVGQKVREYGPREGFMGSAAGKVAETIEGAGRYLQEEKLSGMAEDFTDLIKRNPLPAVLIGIGLGFLLARATSSRS